MSTERSLVAEEPGTGLRREVRLCGDRASRSSLSSSLTKQGMPDWLPWGSEKKEDLGLSFPGAMDLGFWYAGLPKLDPGNAGPG